MRLLQEIAAATDPVELTLMIKELSRLDNSLKWAVQRKILFEAGMLSLCDRKWDASEAALTEPDRGPGKAAFRSCAGAQ